MLYVFQLRSEQVELIMQSSVPVHDDYHKLVLKLSKRMEYIVKLNVVDKDVRAAEPWSTGVYSAGGFYVPHVDTVNIRGQESENEKYPEIEGLDPKTDERIATILAYHTDVIGGRTVFDQLGVSVEPSAGSAVFWFNLHSNGNVDERLRHAACPTVLGIKWISNKWIWEKEQMWKRPCIKQPT